MRKIVFLIFLLVTLFAYAEAQKDGAAKIAGTLSSEGDDILESADNVALSVIGNINSEADLIAVRICSNDPLPITFAFSEVEIYAFFRALTYNGRDNLKNKTFLLRQNKNCRLEKNGLYLVEFWVVPKGAKFPAYVESKRADLLTTEVLTSSFSEFDGEIISSEDWIKLTPDYYKKVELKILDLLKEDKKALVLLETPNSKRVWRAALKTKRFLIRRGIGEKRIFVKKSNYFYADKKYKYPNITVVRQK